MPEAGWGLIKSRTKLSIGLKKNFLEILILRGLGACFFFMDIFPQSSLFHCNSAQSNHMRLVECSLEVEFSVQDHINNSKFCLFYKKIFKYVIPFIFMTV